MKIIPQQLLVQYDSQLNEKEISIKLHGVYRKWLRFYLDFCNKYSHNPNLSESLPKFINKLREKNQSKLQQKQAYDSILIYYEMFTIPLSWLERQPDVLSVKEQKSSCRPDKPKSDKPKPDTQWQLVYSKISEEIKVRHYSPKTLKAYSKWTRKFQSYLKNLPNQFLGEYILTKAYGYLGIELNRVDPRSGKTGEGLGLNLVKQIAEKHKGKVWAESEENKGSVFHIELNNLSFTEF